MPRVPETCEWLCTCLTAKARCVGAPRKEGQGNVKIWHLPGATEPGASWDPESSSCPIMSYVHIEIPWLCGRQPLGATSHFPVCLGLRVLIRE